MGTPMYEQHEPTLIGGLLLDAADPDDDVPAAVCAVCGTASNLRRNPLDGPAGITCLPCLDAALKSLGPPTIDTIGICSVQHIGPDPMQTRYGVVAEWPLNTVTDTRQPRIRACPIHLAEAIASLAAGSP
ncbi:hypothetical protein [Streptomyces sp. NPDC005407]|uniref:hypothetical protein n=1 Tax=Streptomyces sp. NPDC005407 TaxID=3155340 RepID=UPI0033BDAF41